MTPYDMARYLLDQFTPVAGLELRIAVGWGKELASRCCNEIIAALKSNLYVTLDNQEYWQQVKAEIEKL